MSRLLVKPADSRQVHRITPESAGWKHVGGRGSVFDEQPPGVIYVPAGVSAEVTADTSVELAVCSAPGEGNSGSARMIAVWMKP